MSTLKKMLFLFLVIFLISSIDYVIPVEVEGIVESKSINGRMSGNIGEGVLENREFFPDELQIEVENEDFNQFFTPEDRNAYVNDSMKELLERKYVSVDYYVAVRLISDDPANDVSEGETFTYFTSLDDFNKVKIGDKVRYKVARYRFARIDKITVL
ncbi:hypothetical protein [Methanolobus vulcani]|uniref:Uncharacterized protein n=1 Tax=Methanolobus vulcani TaxID=38026 RepID=A0A7Z8KS48_9EURY|nr:hypothetical protein [Methanolobus vulcani]TQD26736.1 hypothetical protein FKV42_04580 [Methanolobus vulcani]